MIDELAAALHRDDDRPAIAGTTRSGRAVVRATRGELAALADDYAGGLTRRGLNQGDTIGVAVRPGARSLAILLAARRLGLRVAALDPTAGPDVLLARIALAHPKLVLADAAAQAAAGWARPLARKVAQLELPNLDAFGPVATVGRRLPGCAPGLDCSRSSTQLADYGMAEHGMANHGMADHGMANHGRSGDAVIVFTSGTTAKPRAVVHTWASLDAGMRAVTDLVRPLPGEPVLGGTMFVLVPALAAGAPVALPARSGRGIARQLRQLRPQATYLTPPALRAALAAGASFTGRVWSGSAPVTAALLTQVKRAGAAQAHGVYALTELFPAAVVEAADKAAFDEPGDLAGELVPGVRARVEASGELYLTGPAACDRYLGERPRRWVATGDVARLHHGGGDTVRIVLAGRSKDMILRAAENIYPGLYEPALHVAGVALAVLVGVPAADGDERVAAVVELAPGADRNRARSALLERFGRMGSARPDVLLFAPVPLSGRSRKPDRQAAAQLVAAATAQSIEAIGGLTAATNDSRRPS